MSENQVIPEAAVEAATKAFRETHDMGDALMNALDAAAPHMLAAAYSLGWRDGTGNPTPVDIETGKLLPGGKEPDYNPYRSEL